jgi:hypothetical protein
MVIDGFLKNAREMVVGEISEYKGKQYSHIRIMVPSAAEEGEWIRTGKGVAIEVTRFSELRHAILQLQEVAALKRTVARIPVGREEIRVGVESFRGNQYVYVRRFYNIDGDWKPTPKGINIRTDALPDLLHLISRMAAALELDSG